VGEEVAGGRSKGTYITDDLVVTREGNGKSQEVWKASDSFSESGSAEAALRGQDGGKPSRKQKRYNTVS